MTSYKALALAALTKREALLRKVETEGRSLTPEESRQESALIDEAEGYVEQAERAMNVNSARSRTTFSPFGAGQNGEARGLEARDGAEWGALVPSLTEYRTLISEGVPADGGFNVPTQVSRQLRDRLRLAAVFLRAKPNEIPMAAGTMVLPTLTSDSGVAVTAELATLPTVNEVFAGPTLAAVKFAGQITASNEVLADSATDLRAGIGNSLVRQAASAFDAAAFSTTAPAGGIKGLLSAGNRTQTALTASQPVTWDNIVDALGAIEAAGAGITRRTVIFASPGAAASLRKAKASTAGTYLAGGPSDGSFETNPYGVPLLVTAALPTNDAVVADMEYVTIGLRQDISLAVSSEIDFDKDAQRFRVTYRIAGIDVQDVRAVQYLKTS